MTGMGEFNSDDHYIYYCGQESLRRNGVAIIVNKNVQSAVLGYIVKNDRIIPICFQGKPFNITVIQVYALTSNAEETGIKWFYEDHLKLQEWKCCYSRYLLASNFCIPVPYNEKDIFFWLLILEHLAGLHRTIQLQLLQRYWSGHRLGLL